MCAHWRDIKACRWQNTVNCKPVSVSTGMADSPSCGTVWMLTTVQATEQCWVAYLFILSTINNFPMLWIFFFLYCNTGANCLNLGKSTMALFQRGPSLKHCVKACWLTWIEIKMGRLEEKLCQVEECFLLFWGFLVEKEKSRGARQVFTANVDKLKLLTVFLLVNWWHSVSPSVLVTTTTDVKLKRALCSCPCECLYVSSFQLLLFIIANNAQGVLFSNIKGNVSGNSVMLWTFCVLVAMLFEARKLTFLLMSVHNKVVEILVLCSKPIIINKCINLKTFPTFKLWNHVLVYKDEMAGFELLAIVENQ